MMPYIINRTYYGGVGTYYTYVHDDDGYIHLDIDQTASFVQLVVIAV